MPPICISLTSNLSAYWSIWHSTGTLWGKEGWLFLCHSPWDTQKGLSPHLQRRWPRSQELIVDLTLDSLQLNTRWSLGHKNPLVVATEPEPPRTEFLHEATTRTSF